MPMHGNWARGAVHYDGEKASMYPFEGLLESVRVPYVGGFIYLFDSFNRPLFIASFVW